MKKRELFMFVCFCSAFVMTAVIFTGCATFQGGGNSGMSAEEINSLEVSPLLKFDDIPVPAGFNIIRDQSFTFQNDVIRVGLLRYVGKATVEQIVSFYRNQMGMYNWRLINVVEFERIVMNFEKDDSVAVITIDPLRGKTVLTITLSPKQ